MPSSGRNWYPAQAIADRNAAALAKISVHRQRIAALQRAVEEKSNWLEFLADLQRRLGNIEDVWLDQLTVVPPPTPRPSGVSKQGTVAAAPLYLRLSGRLLDTHNPVAKVSRDSYERVKQLLAGFASSRFIAAVEDEHFDNSQAGLLRFDFVLAVNPEHPL